MIFIRMSSSPSNKSSSLQATLQPYHKAPQKQWKPTTNHTPPSWQQIAH
uniref:Uncharacterized protein n=1 Tax=Rhizophora mucronata TaxID=61149 RepID=A0A2P2MX83_RHIMU